MNKKQFYVTTPIYYVNDVPHIGHAYTTIAADTIARYKAASGHEVYFLTGTDEHGRKIEQTAETNGETPIELADRVVVKFQELWKLLGISNTDFIRTTETRHHEAVSEIWKLVEKSGDIYLDEYEGWYDVRNEAFVTETQLEEIMKLPKKNRPRLEKIKEQSYFFRLSEYQKPLLRHYREHPEFIKPDYRRNEVITFVEGGLRDLSVSRTNFSWGIPVPDSNGHVVYVWFDALTNYLTSLGFPGKTRDFERFWPADIHLVGKDILRFHAVYWPAFLMSAGLPLPRTVFAHGWWTVEGEKMSKSLGNVVDPYQVIEEFGSEIFRYFLLREIPFGQDGDYSKKSLVNRVNGELVNGLGNLVSRSLGMIERYLEGTIPRPLEFTESEKEIENSYRETALQMHSDLEELAFNRALSRIWEFIALVNRYVDNQAPWKLAKQEGHEKRLGTVLWTLAESIRVISVLIYPFLPETAQNIREKIGLSPDVSAENTDWGHTEPGTSVVKGENLFERIKEEKD
ncbi:MAG: methionine--tRNA ligase [Candidatus Dadabacteria bacterium]|nr:methionine--tRNA ligase [Candidatus Dadabacteria bacterium]